MFSGRRMEELLGGAGLVGPLRTELDLVRLVRAGVPTQAVEHFLRAADLTPATLDHNVLPLRTFKRRREADQPLDPVESDRLVRLVGVVVAADETFGDRAKASAWLRRENRALGGQAPLSLADTDAGARSVETLLGRIAHGLAA